MSHKCHLLIRSTLLPILFWLSKVVTISVYIRIHSQQKLLSCQNLLQRGVIVVWCRYFLKHKNFSQPKSSYSSLYGAESWALFLFTGKICLSLSFFYQFSTVSDTKKTSNLVGEQRYLEILHSL